MSHAKELEIRRQFLDEAQEYLDALDRALLGLASRRVEVAQINAALRAAHSIKGGAAMMGFGLLSDLAHRLEDFFKVLKTPPPSLRLDAGLETLLLSAVHCLRTVIGSEQHQAPPDPDWLAQQVEPVFAQLYHRLGTPPAEDAASLLVPDSGQEIMTLLFETEVEGCLQRLEAVLVHPQQPCLGEEVLILAQELEGLGEMLQLEPLMRLCQQVMQALRTTPAAAVDIAQAALQTWRTTQALVLAGQLEALPTALNNWEPVTATALAPQLASQLSDRPTELEIQPIDTMLESSLLTETWNLQEDWQALEAQIAAQPAMQPELEEIDADEVFAPNETTPPAHTHHAGQGTDCKVLELKPEDAAAAEADSATVRVPVKHLHLLNDLFGELTIERNGLNLYLKRLQSLAQTLVQRVRQLEQSNAHLRVAYDRVDREDNLPVLLAASAQANAPASATPLSSWMAANSPPDTQPARFDSLELDQFHPLHLLSQQVMEMIVQIQESTADIQLSLDDAEQTTRDLNKTARQLQTQLTQLRMRPLADVVEHFPRALRELCLQHGKQAHLSLHGSHTLLDRTVLEALADPLLHLFRNAFDHGIEAPEVRRAAGKPVHGQIDIEAGHHGNRTLIRIRDDGQGIPLEQIRTKAAQMGLDAQLLANASEADLLSLIFEPGFSTKAEVTPLSGRGVGMDVVREHLRQIRGEITVETQTGQGTTFTLSVPLTLSVVQALLVETEGLLLAVPTEAIAEVTRFNPTDVIDSLGGEVLNWQGNIVPLIRLSRWLQFNCPRQSQPFDASTQAKAETVLFVRCGEQLMALHLDRSWGEQEVAIRRVEGDIALPRGFSNCAIIGDGRVVPLVNIPELLDWMAGNDHTPQSSAKRATHTLLPSQASQWQWDSGRAIAESLPVPKASILIVDDSINVRRFLALTLERAGFRVEQAKDGQDALEKLQRGLNVQAVICDVEMPRLDGFGFLAKVKTEPRLEHLPIAMLTSRGGEKHRQLAFSLGATAYFSKPYNEQLLLRQLDQLIASGT
jgi:chemosensory pili system protein ChpA (sensor histidine kinase/response regulator)